ncbi:hypothetical protein BT96DRAFT_844098 [Gymnopus androsaceus JB14]|uniref:Uncharacterized protein n=1 Tax=Gymnopus androsaceus JB14 TaxID=1447944 RepID=A0A6A4GCU3_9AGAR|nr:hypothetical protein BT96DRAFT_844098 [Gymnopus androsaceus JB14]
MQGITVTYHGSKEGKVVKASFTHQGLELDEVVVQVTHSRGLCGTNLHFELRIWHLDTKVSSSQFEASHL